MTPEYILRNPLLAAAVECARHELPVYPAKPRGKNPMWKGWQRGATTKVEHLAEVWQRHPTANVGIACRGIVVLDSDSERGENAVADLDLPPTTTVRTRRGNHRYFLGSINGARTVLPDVELRGKGQGVLGAGSIHPSGHEYTWEIPPWEVAPVPLPAEVRELIEKRRPEEKLPTEPHLVFPGGRSVHLLRRAGTLRARFGIVDIVPHLHLINETECRPPLEAEKVERLAREGAKLAPKPWAVDPIGFAAADSRLSPQAKHLLTLLAYHADHTGECFPGVRRLAELAGMSPRTVIAAIRELEGAVRINVRRSRRGNRYQLLPWDRPDQEETRGENRLSSVTHGVTLTREGAR